MSSEKLPRALAAVAGEEFRRACGRFATGVTIASVLDELGAPHGLTVSSFAAVSLDPPLALICLGHETTSLAAFRAAKYFGINVLGEDQRALSEHFARKGHDRFDGLDWAPGETGVPLLAGVLAQMECAVRQRVTAGDHDVFIGEMLRARVHKGDPLIHFSSRYRKLADLGG
jgi:flavin reductase (DIM6/NTAB) family NADH-FMN oxidoreductase RutF